MVVQRPIFQATMPTRKSDFGNIAQISDSATKPHFGNQTPIDAAGSQGQPKQGKTAQHLLLGFIAGAITVGGTLAAIFGFGGVPESAANTCPPPITQHMEGSNG
jgi:hypothetical protein